MAGQPIGILGGTFDPVHNGHLRLAVELVQNLGLRELRLVPSARPPHRDSPGASPGQRAKWLRVAISGQPQLRLDDCELLRDGPSYTVDTLASLRADLPDTPLCLVMGRDVFAQLPQWDRWHRLFAFAHIVLVERPGVNPPLPAPVESELTARGEPDPGALAQTLAGRIHVCSPPPLETSSTRIRALLAQGKSPRYLLPDLVLDDILDAGVYRGGQGDSAP
ncbi:MAG: nicotinate-nucleotide adenylyltransferase [Salinisphaera sp.]|nr:nicotinate-nucleotide adenylyltransferase [Salinisphaera sp.]